MERKTQRPHVKNGNYFIPELLLFMKIVPSLTTSKICVAQKYFQLDGDTSCVYLGAGLLEQLLVIVPALLSLAKFIYNVNYCVTSKKKKSGLH